MENRLSTPGNKRILTGLILVVLTFWLFANSMMNIAPTGNLTLTLVCVFAWVTAKFHKSIPKKLR